MEGTRLIFEQEIAKAKKAKKIYFGFFLISMTGAIIAFVLSKYIRVAYIDFSVTSFATASGMFLVIYSYTNGIAKKLTQQLPTT